MDREINLSVDQLNDIRKFNRLIDSMPEDYFGVEEMVSGRNELKNRFKQIWQENPKLSLKEVAKQIFIEIQHDLSNPDSKRICNRISFIMLGQPFN